jgi:inosose dehydratase
MSVDRIRLGTAPDSWGVWFPDDPQQVPWQQFLDESAQAGYAWVELGPFGYLPTDPTRLADELDSRGLRLSGGAVFAGLHRGKDALAEAIDECSRVAGLLTALGAGYLVLLPEGYTDLDGTITQPVDLEPEQWADLCTGMSELGRILAEKLGVSLVFHPHADSHIDTQQRVERFLADTDPSTVSLCLDTGHIAYCGGDNLELIQRYPDRIGYVHLKQVDPQIIKRVDEEKLCFADAVKLGAMIEPPNGIPAMEPLIASLARLDADLFAIVEQDLYPCEGHVPLPIATRTRQYLGQCGLGPGHGARDPHVRTGHLTKGKK